MDGFLVWYTLSSLMMAVVLVAFSLALWLSGRSELAARFVLAALVVLGLPLILLWAFFRLVIPSGHDE